MAPPTSSASRGGTGARAIRVLWLAKGLGPGGMERLLLTHARVGDRDAFEYHAAYLVERPNSVVGALRDAGIPCTRLGGTNPNDPRWSAALRRLVRDERIDVVHIHSPMVAALARPALRTMRPRPGILYTEHNSWDCYGGITRLANAATYRLDDHQVAVSTAAATSAPHWLSGGVEALTHGIDLDGVAAHLHERDEARRELGIAPDETVVVVVANLRHEKGYDLLLPAAAEVVRKRPDVVFLAVGQGPLEAAIREQHEQLGLGDRFRMLGFRPDVPRVMAGSDVFALASRNEGLPVALMEAAAIGLPVVVPRVGGLPEVVDDGTTGLLVEPERPDLLAGAVLSVVEDPELRSRLALGARDLARRFDARHAVRRLEEIYRELRP